MKSRENRIDPESDALVVVDVQNDFCPGGALPVARGDEVVEPLERLLRLRWALIAGTRDWHPRDHASFRDQGGPWPPHCIQETPGAAFHPALRTDRFDIVISKGTDPDDPGFSPLAGTVLEARLHAAGVRRVLVAGLATEYCVKTAVLDLLAAGFRVVLLADAARAIEVMPGDGMRATDAMRRAGAVVSRASDLAGIPA